MKKYVLSWDNFFLIISNIYFSLTRQYRYGVFSPLTLPFFSLKLFSLKFHICRVVFQGKSIYLSFGSVRCVLIALRITISAQRGVRLLERRFWSEPAVKQKITFWQIRKFRSRRILNFRIILAEAKFQNRNHGALFSSSRDFNARFRYFDLIKYRQKWHEKNNFGSGSFKTF